MFLTTKEHKKPKGFDWHSKFCFQKNYEENNKIKQNNKNVYSFQSHSCLKIFLMTCMPKNKKQNIFVV